MKSCCKDLTILLDTRLATHLASNLQSFKGKNTEFDNLLMEILLKGSCYHLVSTKYDTKTSQHEEVKRTYNEFFCQSKPYNQVFIYDQSNYPTRMEIYRTTIQNLTRYEDVLSRLLDFNYKYLVHDEMFRQKDISSTVLEITQFQDIDTLISIMLNITNLLHEKLYRDLAGSDVIQPMLDLACFNLVDIEFKAMDVLDRVFHCLNAHKKILQHGMVILSKDPTEPYGGMCRYWGPDLPFLLFSPYYGKMFSVLTFMHEIGHLIHYKNMCNYPGPCVLSPVVEEFFAIYAELICVKRNFLDLSKFASERIFWQRIWYLIVRQFQIFLFEKMNLEASQHTNLNPDILTYNWQHSWELILGKHLKPNDIFFKSWIMYRGSISLPFRSISYVLATMIVLWLILQDIGLSHNAYRAEDIKSLLCYLDLPSLDTILEDTIKLIS